MKMTVTQQEGIKYHKGMMIMFSGMANRIDVQTDMDMKRKAEFERKAQAHSNHINDIRKAASK